MCFSFNLQNACFIALWRQPYIVIINGYTCITFQLHYILALNSLVCGQLFLVPEEVGICPCAALNCYVESHYSKTHSVLGDFVLQFSYMFVFLLSGPPQALLQGCATFAAFSCIMEGLNKQQAAMARTIGGTAVTVVHEKGGVLPPFTLPPILDASDALASCCLALVKPKHQQTTEYRA